MSDNTPACTICAKTFSQKKGVYKHMRNVHHVEVDSGGPLSCPMCERKVRRYTDLAGHMEETHDKAIQKEELTFACIKEFNAWKKKIEKENRSLYVKDCGSHHRTDGKKRTLYRCNRDGSYRDRVGTGRKKSLKSQGSCKIEARCPSFIIMEEGATNLTVTFYKQHFGHRLSLRHLFLSEEDRKQIAGLLESGTQPSTVLEIVRDNSVNREQFQRINILTKKDMHNITRDFKLQKDRLHPNDAAGPDLLENSEKQSLINKVKVLEGYFRLQEMSIDNIKSAQKDLDVLLAKYKNLPLKNNEETANEKMDNLDQGQAENIHTQFDHTYC